jgi:hypothetical protein
MSARAQFHVEHLRGAPARLLRARRPGSPELRVRGAAGGSARVRVVRSQCVFAAGSYLLRRSRTHPPQTTPGSRPDAVTLRPGEPGVSSPNLDSRCGDGISVRWNIPVDRAALRQIGTASRCTLSNVPRGTGSAFADRSVEARRRGGNCGQACVEASSAQGFSACREIGPPHLSLLCPAAGLRLGPGAYRPGAGVRVDAALGAGRVNVPRGTFAGAGALLPAGGTCKRTLGSRCTRAGSAGSRWVSRQIGPGCFSLARSPSPNRLVSARVAPWPRAAIVSGMFHVEPLGEMSGQFQRVIDRIECEPRAAGAEPRSLQTPARRTRAAGGRARLQPVIRAHGRARSDLTWSHRSRRSVGRGSNDRKPACAVLGGPAPIPQALTRSVRGLRLKHLHKAKFKPADARFCSTARCRASLDLGGAA